VIIPGLAILLGAVSTHAQGTVVFANPGAPISNFLTQAPVPAGQQFWVALYWLPDSPIPPTPSDFDAAGSRACAAITNFIAPGVFHGGVVRIGLFSPGAQAWFQVRAWEHLYGSREIKSYEEAILAPYDPFIGRPILVGTSNIFKVDTGDPTTTPPQVPAPIHGAGKLQGFYVGLFPEPSLVALGLLAISAAWLGRRPHRLSK